MYGEPSTPSLLHAPPVHITGICRLPAVLFFWFSYSGFELWTLDSGTTFWSLERTVSGSVEIRLLYIYYTASWLASLLACYYNIREEGESLPSIYPKAPHDMHPAQ
ncbi:uncharacterized protein LAJ45_01773 [Morchella importuna]|uniref:uncharacterized protein n=1 Tax=Morchella importuna TaxID=1174673 RepID=UPI001E8DE684|nr:uncharacterized protein LAJ45_01773 [Morchella importuna]KAH8154006.1 hypothetical protein LAJ45_01773 [Morchella importuna]